MQPIRLRMCLSKDEAIRFVSHLEYAKALERALRRAKLPAAYSEGFNPHMKLSLASALAVGTTSRCEYAEVELTEKRPLTELTAGVAAALPPGMRLVQAILVEGPMPKLMAVVAGAAYEVTLPFDGDEILLQQQIEAFLAMPSFPYEKRSPKGKATKQLDLRVLIRQLRVAVVENGQLCIALQVAMPPAGTIKPLEALQALQAYFHWTLPLERALVERVELFADRQGSWQPLLGG